LHPSIPVKHLLATLCEELGICLPPEEQVRIAAMSPLTVEAFADAVLQAEGLDPNDQSLRRQILARVAKAFP
jgi:hypothetical protein